MSFSNKKKKQKTKLITLWLLATLKCNNKVKNGVKWKQKNNNNNMKVVIACIVFIKVYLFQNINRQEIIM